MACPFGNPYGGNAFTGSGCNYCNCRARRNACGARGMTDAVAAAMAAETARRIQSDLEQRPRNTQCGGGSFGCGCGNSRNTGCACTQTVANQLYGGSALEAPVYVSCCDPSCGCRQYRLADRDPYWPAFSHPRWLSCDDLYRVNRSFCSC